MSTRLGTSPSPPGVIPDFEHPTDVLKTINTVAYSLAIGLSTLVVSGRFYVRLRITKALLVEDWFCLASWIFIIGFCITGILSGLTGGGFHTWEVTPVELMGFQKVEYAASILYGPAMWFIKATLLLILVRVFTPLKKIIFFVWGFIIVMFIYYTVVTILKILLCDPIESIWDPTIPGTCLNRSLLFSIDTGLSVLTDVIILILPIPLVWSLQVTPTKKLRTIALLGAGGVATATSVIRLVLLLQFVNSPSQIDDQTVSIVRINLLVAAELGIGIICACLPAFNALFTRYTTKRASRTWYMKNSMKMSRLTRSKATIVDATRPRSSYVEIGTPQDIGSLISPLERIPIANSRRNQGVENGMG